MREALEQLSGRISTQNMRRMNYAVDGEKRDVSDVMHDFLTCRSRATFQDRILAENDGVTERWDY
jgi:uncharacterized protein YukJ